MLGSSAALSMQTRSALMQVLRALEAAMPAEEVAHSLHADAVRNAALRASPAMELYTEASRDHMEAMVSTAGYIRRILSGDAGVEAWMGLQTTMMSLHPSHVAARDAFRELMREPAAADNRAIQALSQVLGVVEQAHGRVMGTVQPLATIDVGGSGQSMQDAAPGAGNITLLVHCARGYEHDASECAGGKGADADPQAGR